MIKNELPLIHAYWKKAGRTLIKEFPAVKGTNTNEPRRIDAIIIPCDENKKAHWKEVDLEGKDIIPEVG